METDIIFTITNEFTGVRMDVHGTDLGFTVEITDVDLRDYVDSRTFELEHEAIAYAIAQS